MPLTAEQLDTLRKDGAVSVSGLVPKRDLAYWRSAVWDALELSPTEQRAWPNQRSVLKDFRFEQGRFPSEHPAIHDIVEQLGGGRFIRGQAPGYGGGTPIVKWPKPGTWQMPEHGHIDGFPPPDGYAPFALGLTLYLDDVASGEGAFVYWPGSHLTTHQYFQRRPHDATGAFQTASHEGWKLFSTLAPNAPREFLGRAGSVLFWHSYLCHAGSQNVGVHPRLAVLARYRRRGFDPSDPSHTVPQSPWSGWGLQP